MVTGRMRAIVERCAKKLLNTTRYDRPLTEMQSVQATLGRMYASVEASRSVIYRALERQAGSAFNPIWDPIVSAAKYTVTEQANQLALNAFRLTGGGGYADSMIGRFQRDVAGFIAAAGTQDSLEVNMGAHVVHQLELEVVKSSRRRN
jgi:alkylation response protein AidB-like acyl-CoA dehydrogenase